MTSFFKLIAVALILGLVSLTAQAQPYGGRGYHRPPPRRFYHRPVFHRPPLIHREERR